ncbi:extracellular solute-binding protein [Niallia sp. 03091]|uniref:extracellular solute-binding protein n=1 Tax=unclassified Niallia TaxID=2837522 RepID=UPI0040449A98
MILRWIVIIMLVVLVAGCEKSKIITKEKVQPYNKNNVQTIEFWHTYSDKESRILERQMIPSFEQKFPSIKVVSVRKPYNNGLKNTLIARAFSNHGPDVVRMKVAWVPDFYKNKLLMPLNDFPDFQKVLHALNNKTLSAGFNENKYYSLPMDLYIQVAIFNRELLEKAGYSQPPHTMEEILELAGKERYRIGLGGLNIWRTLPYIYGLGGSLTDTEFRTATGYLNGEATVRAVEKLLGLYKEGLIDRMVGEEGGDNWEGVKSGNVLITGEGPWFYNIWTEKELYRSLNSTIAIPFPHDNGPSSLLDGENLVIMKGSEEKEAAWTFLRWMTSKEAQLMMSRAGIFPTNLEAADSMNVNRDSYTLSYQEALEYSFQRPSVENWDEIDKVYTLYMNKIFQGELSPKKGLMQAAEEIDHLLSASGSD